MAATAAVVALITHRKDAAGPEFSASVFLPARMPDNKRFVYPCLRPWHNSSLSWWRFRSGGSVVEAVSLEGQVEIVDGELAILIPPDAGGAVLAPFAKGIGEIDGEFLKVVTYACGSS